MAKVSFLSFHCDTSMNSSCKPRPPTVSASSSNGRGKHSSSSNGRGKHSSSSNARGKHSSSFNGGKMYQPNTAEMHKVFSKYDTNKDGKISREEYEAILRVIGQGSSTSTSTEEEVARVFEVADIDGDGFIDFKEFMEVNRVGGGLKLFEVQDAFRAYDLDGDGKISATELMEVLRRIGETFTLEACRNMVRGVDRDGDGFIDMDEFTTMMTRTMEGV